MSWGAFILEEERGSAKVKVIQREGRRKGAVVRGCAGLNKKDGALCEVYLSYLLRPQEVRESSGEL